MSYLSNKRHTATIILIIIVVILLFTGCANHLIDHNKTRSIVTRFHANGEMTVEELYGHVYVGCNNGCYRVMVGQDSFMYYFDHFEVLKIYERK